MTARAAGGIKTTRKLGAANHASACIIATQLGLQIEPQRKTT